MTATKTARKFTTAQRQALTSVHRSQRFRHGSHGTGYFVPSRVPHTPLGCAGYTAATVHSLVRAGLLRIISREMGDGWMVRLTPAGMRTARPLTKALDAWLAVNCPIH